MTSGTATRRSVPTNVQTNNQQRQAPPIPFPRAARRKSIQAFSQTYTLAAGATTPVQPIELPAAGFLRDMEIEIAIASTGNAATVAAPTVTDLPWNVIASMQITNASGDTIYVPMNGYFYYLINKYGGMYQPPFCDPRALPRFVALTTGAGATAGSGNLFLNVPFELDPRDAFCALPNLAANKAYQVQITLASISAIWQGVAGVAPNGTVTATITITLNYWSQPNTQNGAGMPQMTAPEGVGSVSLWRLQTQQVSGGDKISQLFNVGNVIREVMFVLYDNAGVPKRDDTDWPAINYLRLNNDQLFYKPSTNWLAEMKQFFGYGSAAQTKDTAGQQDTGVYVVGDFMCQHGSVEVDSPRDQYLVTLDATLLQHEGANFGANASTLWVLTNEVKPIRASALYSINAV